MTEPRVTEPSLQPYDAAIAGCVDLARYPLDQPHRLASLVERCQRALADNGMFNLQGFMRADAVARCVAQVEPLLENAAFVHARSHNIYFTDTVEGLSADHPALARMQTINHTICADQIPDALVCTIYQWPPLAEFLAKVMKLPALYTMDDPLAQLNVMAYRDGEALNWHFDRSEFTVTLLLQAPQTGGIFEYRSDLRSNENPNHDGIARLLAGEDRQVRALTLAPGDLNVFLGRNTAHRITPVSGPRQRIVTVLSYYDRPGVTFSPEERIGFFGRAG